MPIETLRCPHCGALLGSASATRCDYCGSSFARPAAGAAPATSSEVRAPELLARLSVHPDLGRLLAHMPAVPSPVFGSIAIGLFGAGFTALALIALVGSSPAGPLVIVPIILVLVGLGVVAQAALRLVRHRRAELEKLPALVVAQRVRESLDPESRQIDVSGHLMTLELSDGTRRELACTAEQFGLFARGDAGVAYVHGPRLIDFQRVEL